METHQQGSDTKRKWLIGCGIGCGAVLIIVVLLVAGGFFFFKNLVRNFEESDRIMEQVIIKYGQITDFSPDPEGQIRPARMEAFLAVQDSSAVERDTLEESMEILFRNAEELEAGDKSAGKILQTIGKGFSLIPQMARFFSSRSQALLDSGMGMGEYLFIYSVAYYSWLGKPPGDGPRYQIMEDDERIVMNWDEAEDDYREERDRRTRRQVNKFVLPMLKNQLQRLKSEGASSPSVQWRAVLEEEIKAMEDDSSRIPWQDGIPDVLQKSLNPYKQRLEKNYRVMLNPFEIGIRRLR